MAVKEPLAIKTVLGDNDIELQADPGEAFIIRDVLIHNPAENWATLKTEKTTVGYFRVGAALGSHLPFAFSPGLISVGFRYNGGTIGTIEYNRLIDAAGNNLDLYLAAETAATSATTQKRATYPEQVRKPNETILAYLRRLGIFDGYPVAEGEKFIVEGVKQTDSICMILYEIHDPDDISPEMPNGSKSTKYTFVNYGDTGGNITTADDHIIDTAIPPAEFPAFPFGKVVPAKTRITLHGILGSTVLSVGSTVSDYIYTKFLKLIHQRQTLFDEDRNGILFYHKDTPPIANYTMAGEGWSPIGNLSDVDAKPPFIFPEPIVFEEGDELNVYVTTGLEGSGGTITTPYQQLGFIMTVERVE